ncbi:MAG TPA: fimbrial assembly protein [Cyanobacteria bacterium UBA11149]|nr:fimbrial assembly protein [Cyanobacteria bacterium UBA11367]HBE59830.1 fimbrial assembly protein [Cyanobacteria bacterium UBA11366]HBK64785.1 fimbrial assembly protein [Cyanobacteria bacterium UBA11166]HBR76592.1 fimbrial assembly protein [Cyanobacteria bacterium UBA11159]HBS70622.1 fimbrial assembly protein [Cyanobacteria bacterium UBA11153]HBW92388.1 fimbrial assembly protein [Cyanobacteria bacterium UBA11149]HCA96573.1 fimbrial assembly protein [Cyanobacteria bacterium UBA9226]
MYSLDVNFLKDRDDYLQTDQKPEGGRKKPVQIGSMTPLIVGVVVGLIALCGVGGAWFWLQGENTKLAEEKAELDQKLAAAQALKGEVNKINEDIKKVKEETNALATVFNQIKPWSAMLQDIRERTPAGIQIQSVQQNQVVSTTSTPPPTPAASPNPNAPAPFTPPPTISLEISGTARSFDEVNYFVLSMQKSSFLESGSTELVSAQVIDNPTKLELPKEEGNKGAGKVIYELPKLVSYKIKTNLNNVPASEILRDLDRKGAVGLVTRIRNIQQIEQNKITKPNTQINRQTPTQINTQTPTQTKSQTPTGVSTP